MARARNLTNLPLRYRPVRRLSALFAGLALYGASMSLMLAAKLGLDPWDVFHQGVAKLTGLRFGWVVIAVGVAVLVLWIPMRQRPGIGTVANAIVIGLVANVMNAILPIPHALWLRWTYGVAGVVLTGVASGLYIGARLGPGPRDGLMTGLVAKWHGRKWASIRVVRTGLEATVFAIGFMMGGTVGWITLLFAISIGPIAHVTIPMFAIADPRPSEAGQINTDQTHTGQSHAGHGGAGRIDASPSGFSHAGAGRSGRDRTDPVLSGAVREDAEMCAGPSALVG